MSWDIRAFHQNDLSHCVDLLRCNTPAFFADHEAAEFKEDLRLRQRMPEAKRWPYFVMHCGSEYIGCGGYFIDSSGVASLIWGMIHPALHRQGYGHHLFNYRLRHMMGKATKVEIDTTPVSFPFYQKMGFHQTQVIKDGYAPDLDKVLAYRNVS